MQIIGVLMYCKYDLIVSSNETCHMTSNLINNFWIVKLLW